MKHDWVAFLTCKGGLYQTNRCSLPLLVGVFDIQPMSLVFSSRRRYPEGRTKLASSFSPFTLHYFPTFLLSLFFPPFFSNSLQVTELPPPFSPNIFLLPSWQLLTLLPFLQDFFVILSFIFLFLQSASHYLHLSLTLPLNPPSVPATTVL